MSEYYMGAELRAQELPSGSAVPSAMPAEGVIIPMLERDGWTRKYLHQMGRNPICIAEIPPQGGVDLSGADAAAAGAPENSVPPSSASLIPLRSGSPVPVSQPVRVPVPGQQTSLMMAGPIHIRMGEGPGPAQVSPGSPVANLGGSLAMMKYPLRLSQAAAPAPAPAGVTPLPVVQPGAPPPLPPNSDDPTCGLCPPGPLQLPDGRIVQLDDPITLKDLCEMMPAILKAMQVSCGAQGAPPAPQGPQGAIPLQKPNMAGFPGFGPSNSPFGTGGGGGGGGGGLPGPLGVVNQAVPQGGPGQNGGPGPTGAQGPPGQGTQISFITKDDGDFTAGPGSFIPVPGTLLSFTQGADGNVMFFVNAVFGCDQATNDALAIRVDGTTVIPLQATLVHVAAPVQGFFMNASALWPMFLAAGGHTVELMLRGIGAGEFCSGSGLGSPATLAATPDTPVALAVQHNTTGVAPAGSVGRGKDFVEYQSGDLPIPSGAVPGLIAGTSYNLTLGIAGKVTFTLSSVFIGTGTTPSAQFGLRIDGQDKIFAKIEEENLGGQFATKDTPMGGVIGVNLTAGPHTIQWIGCSTNGTPKIKASGGVYATMDVDFPVSQ